ncbi:putative adenylate-forming enzyme [Paenibacillus sp. UNCCL117]|uniref:F390 synthetase-related protein n=1 Tax=unclassified Paenibacillus TaxID=185978 RepID=UPI00088D6F4C|nr:MULTISPECIES: F390 synthetase-related protein [unclassified Paenibacillus]SDD23180.1 putative adenylate-forming enzyme [Paenibacillus sp. cl123]SFW41731.1 putative adenylate-forming enzyme [Paenibacillus sp. UNCCL117]
MKSFERLCIAAHYMRARMRGRRWTDRAALERWQQARVIRHLERIRETSAFYRELWGERPVSEWEKYPIIDKQAMMEGFDRLNTAGISRDEAFKLALAAESTRDFTPAIGHTTVGLSSGTSGSRGLFLVSRRERLAWAGTVLARVLPGSLLDRHAIAFFLRADSNLYGTVGGGRIDFQFYDLLNPPDQHIARLNRQRPTVLVGPPSMLRLLAEASRSGLLRIQPQRVIGVAEVLEELDRRFIEEAFGQKLHQVYQCTEGFLGATCGHGTLHLNEDIVCVQKEALDEQSGRFAPIITDFSRMAQPIIRYRLNDVLTERSEPCPCGSVLLPIARIEGRCDDILTWPALSGAGMVTVFPDYISRAIISASELILAYHAVWAEKERILNISLEVKQEAVAAEIREQVAREIAGLCDRLGCRLPELRFLPYTFEPGARKLRRVERRASS